MRKTLLNPDVSYSIREFNNTGTRVNDVIVFAQLDPDDIQLIFESWGQLEDLAIMFAKASQRLRTAIEHGFEAVVPASDVIEIPGEDQRNPSIQRLLGLDDQSINALLEENDS